LDGRAAILVVVARPRGFELFGCLPDTFVAFQLDSASGHSRRHSPVLTPRFRRLATAIHRGHTFGCSNGRRTGGEMLAAVALLLLLAWVLGIVGAYDVGDLVHVLLLIALWLLLLAFATGRDTAVRSKGSGDRP
jgi:hypothetical protein